MLLSDGITPSNEGRGYILRRLLRRTIRSMRLLGVDAPTFSELFSESRDAMKSSYPEVETDYDRIHRLAAAEEETFLRTLASGTSILDVAVNRTQEAGAKQLAGDTAFLLHDTFGFPIDLTLEMAEEAGLTVDRPAFDRLMLEQRTMAKADAKAKKTLLADLSVYSSFRAMGETIFTGYDYLNTESTVLGLIVGGASVSRAVAGDIAEVILAETSLYPESGGQEADAGSIVGTGFDLEVLDVQRPVKGLVSHRVQVRSGEVGVGDAATSVVDPEYRRGATQAHSATHLIHAALREVLGPEAHQAGSDNRAGYMRLDFNWNKPLSLATRSEIEEIANNAVRQNLEVSTRIMPLDEARELGAMALFGEKYGETVRVVEIGGPWSLELCAGTHVTRSAEVGLINVISETSVGSSNRRIESLVGLEAFRDLATERAIVSELTTTLKTPRDQVPARISELLASLKAAEKRIAEFESAALIERVPALLTQAGRIGSVTSLITTVGALASSDDLRTLVTTVRGRLGSDPLVVALAADVGGKPAVIVATNEAARRLGVKAGTLAKTAAGILGGGGGGKDDLAQGGGSSLEAIPAALEAISAALPR
jgi:alanyl-tRNA synthetase